MQTQGTSRRPLTQLNYEIEAAEAEVDRLERERKAVAIDAAKANRRLAYYRLAKRLRQAARSFEMAPIVMMLVGPFSIGFLTLLVVHLVTGSLVLALLGFLASAAAVAVTLLSLLYYPADAAMSVMVNEAQSQSQLANARLGEKSSRISEVNQRLEKLTEERRDQIATGKLQRAALLQRPWKTMRGTEWEDFVVEVLRTHGATVERVGSGHGSQPHLMANFSDRRVAILTEGEGPTVDSAAIRQAISAKQQFSCDSAAIIINRRFTGAAQDFASRNGCQTIGTVEFPDFVMGKIEL